MSELVGGIALALVIFLIIILIIAAIFYFVDRGSFTAFKLTNITSTNSSDTYTSAGNNIYVYTATPSGSTGSYTLNFSNASGSTGQLLYITNNSGNSSTFVTTSGLGLPSTGSSQGANYIANGNTNVYVISGTSTAVYLGFMAAT